MKIKLTYFRLFGKFYTNEEYDFAAADHTWLLNDIWAHIEQLRDEKRLPGLKEGHSDYIIAVSVPDHPNDHPVLILPDEMDALGIEIEGRR